jgi:hypothetical protein
VLGHREALLSAIRSLPVTYDQAEEPWHHQPSADSPESPVLKAKLHRQKLLRELEKAQTRSAALHRQGFLAICLQPTQHTPAYGRSRLTVQLRPLCL